MEDNELEKQSLNSQASDWDSVSLGQSQYLDVRLPQLEINRASPIPPPDLDEIGKQDLPQKFLCVPSRTTLYSGRTSPSVAGSVQSDPESCMDTSRYQQDDSDTEVMDDDEDDDDGGDDDDDEDNDDVGAGADSFDEDDDSDDDDNDDVVAGGVDEFDDFDEDDEDEDRMMENRDTTIFHISAETKKGIDQLKEKRN
ncbi:unnamed protein product [Enterobius vermicularis]|uniref:Uncharacterized protein n=1 Tax=Enterobius vermicularis TaxID=51028 RepID=A0A158QB20_ENTVE|nr:unnamed protein product [Enterobius vermicularis]